MDEIRYTSNTAAIKRLLEHVQTGGVPEKVTQKYLESVGFKSKNDRTLIPIWKALGFIDSSGVPSDVWRAYRNKKESRAVMASAIRETYRGLFDIYPDADRKDHEALRNYFSTQTKVGEGALGYIVRTFKALCELADFGAAPVSAVSAAEAVAARAVAGKEVVVRPTSGEAPLTVNLNIQLQLPATDDATIYDKFFEAMKKHLLS